MLSKDLYFIDQFENDIFKTIFIVTSIAFDYEDTYVKLAYSCFIFFFFLEETRVYRFVSVLDRFNIFT